MKTSWLFIKRCSHVAATMHTNNTVCAQYYKIGAKAQHLNKRHVNVM